MCSLNCYYAEDHRFDCFFGWLRATQHCACDKWLPTCRRLQSTVNLCSCSNLQSQNWTESYSNLQSQKWTERCKEVQNKIYQFQPKSVEAKMITSKSINILECRMILIQVHVHQWSFSCIGHAKDKEVYVLCCDRKAWAASAQSFTLAASNNRDHPTKSTIIASSRHIYFCFALCTHPVRGESHIQRNTNWEVAVTLPTFCNEPEVRIDWILFFFVSGLLLPPTGSGVRFSLLQLESDWIWIFFYAKDVTGSNEILQTFR